MRTLARRAAAGLLMLPGAAWAGDGSYSLIGSVIQMVAALAIVVGLILLFHYVANRWLNTSRGPLGMPRYIRLIESRHLAPKKSLVLVEVGGEYLLLANSGDNLTFIKQVNMLEEIEVLEIPGEERFGSAFRDRLQEFLQKIPKHGARPDPQ